MKKNIFKTYVLFKLISIYSYNNHLVVRCNIFLCCIVYAVLWPLIYIILGVTHYIINTLYNIHIVF